MGRLPLASFAFSLSLYSGLSPRRDAIYVVLYAVAGEALASSSSWGTKDIILAITTAIGLGAAALFKESVLSLFSSPSCTTKASVGGLKPMFFPVRTSHTRIYPRVHSLSYPFMWTGIPIGFRGNLNGILSSERKIEILRPAWFAVDACDYMARGNDGLGLDGKLHEYLISQGSDPVDYPYAYLLTVAKFCGHAFNPVSFWYLYSSTKELAAVIAEVNNTFGERHLYFLTKENSLSPSTASSETTFRNKFQKDFFVSPFSKRTGDYSLVTNDPLYPNMAGLAPIKLALTLSSTEGKPKLVARVYSEGSPVDPASLNWWQGQRFAINKAWDTWATEPRTVYQAVLLMLKKGLHIFTVPEPLKASISRKALGHEVVIEGVFRKWLKHMIGKSCGNVVLLYTAAGIPGSGRERMASASAEADKIAGEEESWDTDVIELDVLTPVFYARLVRYYDPFSGLEEEAAQGQTTTISDIASLRSILQKSERNESVGNEWAWPLLAATMRRQPKGLVIAKEGTGYKEQAMPASRMEDSETCDNALDVFVKPHFGELEQRKYRKAVLKLLVSDHVALSNMDLLALERFVVRAGLVWMAGNAARLDTVAGTVVHLERRAPRLVRAGQDGRVS